MSDIVEQLKPIPDKIGHYIPDDTPVRYIARIIQLVPNSYIEVYIPCYENIFTGFTNNRGEFYTITDANSPFLLPQKEKIYVRCKGIENAIIQGYYWHTAIPSIKSTIIQGKTWIYNDKTLMRDKNM